jgi:O-antigen ligase
VTAEEQARYTREAYTRARTEWPWIGGLIIQHWQPDAPADDPIQGFAVAPVIDSWQSTGEGFSSAALMPGRYPAQNAFTSYSPGWHFSELGADADIPAPGVDVANVENRITVAFEGTAFAIATRRDDYLAYLVVTVDGQPANALPRNRQGDAFIVLTSPKREASLDLIVVAKGLADGPHTAEIIHRPAQGDDFWPIAGFAVGSPPDRANDQRALIACALIGGLAVFGAVITAWRLPWSSLQAPALPTVRQLIEWVLSLLASFVVLLGALATWGETIPSLLRRDQPALAITVLTAGIASLSPVAVITLAALVVLLILIYNRPLLGLMLIIFWSAFFVSSLDLLFSAFATVEVYFVLTLIALIARGIVAWAQQRRLGTWRQPVIRLNRLDWLVLAFAVLGVVSLSWVEFWPQATRQLRVVILEPAAFYFMIRLMRLDRRDWLWLADTLVMTGVAIALVGLYGYVTGAKVVDAENGARRLISVYGSPNGVGLYLGRCLPFAFGYVLMSRRGSWRWLYGVICGAIMLLAVLLSQSRGAILLGLPAALVVTLLVWRGRRALLPVGLAVIGLIVVLIPLSLALPRLGDLFGDTLDFRRNLWYSSARLIEERPLTGVGLDQFLYWYRSRYLLPEAWEDPNLSIPHNILLNHWVNLGILGVLIGAWFQVEFWQRVVQLWQRVSTRDPLVWMLLIGLAGSMADMLGHGLVDVGYFAVNLAFVFFLLLGLLQRLDQSAEPMA